MGTTPAGRCRPAPRATAASAALLLEESRIEAAHLTRRSGDRHWISAAVRTLILADFADAAMTKWNAAQAAGLLLARVDSGVIDDDEVTTVTAVVEKVLGRTRLAKLRRIWRRAHTTRDDDAAGMLELGSRWCRALGVAPDRATPGRGKPSSTSGKPSPLAEAVTTALDVVATADRPRTARQGHGAGGRAGESSRVHEDRSHGVRPTDLSGNRRPIVCESFRRQAGLWRSARPSTPSTERWICRDRVPRGCWPSCRTGSSTVTRPPSSGFGGGAIG